MNLSGYHGSVEKTATITCNDPQRPSTQIALQGKVRMLIDIRPTDTVSFRGMAENIGESSIDLVSNGPSFHITRIDTDLEGKISQQLETVEDGKHYRLKLTNLVKQGNYAGLVILNTDLTQKSDIMIRVSGSLVGEISVDPRILVVGKLAAQKPMHIGKVTVTSNAGKPFHIAKLSYDEKLIEVTQNPLPNQGGISLEITPKVESIPSDLHRLKTVLTIETDVAPEEKYEVQVQVLNAQ